MSATFNVQRLDGNNWHRIPGLEGVNVSNCNASDILANLGLSPDFNSNGVYPIEQFDAECATFLRIASGTEVDEKRPTREDGRWIECGRRDGYLTQRISEVQRLVCAGMERGATHVTVG